jgi:hypothetical protein
MPEFGKFATGRTRSITVSGTLSGSTQGYISRTWASDMDTIIGEVDRVSVIEGGISALGVALSWLASWDNEAITLSYGESVSGPGGSDSENTTYGPIGSPPGGGTAIIDPGAATPTGTWSVTVHLREYLLTTDGGEPSPSDSPGITAAKVWWEHDPDAADASWSISFGAATASGTVALTGDCDFAVTLTGHAFSAGETGTLTVDTDYVTAPETSSLSNSGGSYSAGGDTLTVTANAEIHSGPPETNTIHEAHGTLFATRLKEYTLAGIVRAMEDAYPDTLTINVANHGSGSATLTASGGSYSGGGDQRLYSCSGDVDGTSSTTKSKSEWGPLSLSIDSGTLADADDDTTATRVQIRGLAWSAASFGQASSVTVDDGSTLTPAGAWEGDWTGGGDVSPSIASGAVQFSSAGGSGTLSRTFDDPISLSSYRFLRVRIRSVGSADQSLTLTVNGKEWQVTTGAAGTFVDADIDLCAEQNESATTSTADSHWPPDGDGLPSVEGVYFGVGKTDTIGFSDLPAGVTFEIDALTLRRASYTRLTFLPSLSAPFRRFLLGDTDGRQSLEETDADAVTDQYPPRSILDLIASVNLVTAAGSVVNPGWTASDLEPAPGSGCSPSPPALPPVHDCYYNSDLPATYLQGAGALNLSGSWTYGFDRDASGTLSVSGQPLYDSIEWAPDSGDVFGTGDGSLTGPIQLAAAAILRGQVIGLVLDNTHAPSSGVEVDVKTGGGTARGDGTTGSDGAYQTGLSYPRGGESDIVEAMAGDHPNVTIGFFTRKRNRAVFVAVSRQFRVIAIDAPRQWLHVGLNQRIRTFHLGVWSMAFESADYPVDEWVSLTTDERGGRLFGVGIFDDMGTTKHKIYRSYDGGATAEEVLEVTADSARLERDSERSHLLLLTQAGMGHVQMRESLDAGATWSSATDILDDAGTEIDGDVLDIAQDTRLGGAFVSSINQSGNVIIIVSYDMGATWKQVLG